jgi:hypothetical protein
MQRSRRTPAKAGNRASLAVERADDIDGQPADNFLELGCFEWGDG